jgi:hypothetical protein
MEHIKILKNYFFLFLFFLNFLFSQQKYDKFEMMISTQETILEIFHIDDNNGICEFWIPSLFTPILIVPRDKEINEDKKINTFKFKSPILAYEEEEGITVDLYYYDFLAQKFNVTLGKIKSSNKITNCYFGLNSKSGENQDLENSIILNQLKINRNITEPIFSFDKWTLTNDNNYLKTTLYYGDSHDNFKKSNGKGIVGTCKTSNLDPYWGCIFNQMSFNGKSIDLKNKTHTYKIYFSSENHNIIFPKTFKGNFDYITNGQCHYITEHLQENEYYVYCDNIFNNDYVLLNLINDDMNITIEIDNVIRYNNGNGEKNRTRIKYEDIDYFIFPLIMFKNFHVQFDDKNNLISFYTLDKSILKVKKDEKNKGSSKGLIVFFVILVIILILVLVFLAYRFLKNRRGSLQKNINKYNKFEEDEDFQNMNEKRVF